MAGSVAVTEVTSEGVKKIKYEWTSGDDGTASGTTTIAYSGELLRLVTIPDGDDAPDDNYDITITDEDDVDVLAGAGANLDTTITEQALAANLGCVANDKLTLNVSNAGNAKKGTVILYLR